MADEHWKLVPGEQHHRRAFRLDLNWYEGNMTKYTERCRHKGVFLDDLLKVLDYTVLYLDTARYDTPTPVQCAKAKDIAERLVALFSPQTDDAWERRQLNKALDEAAKRGDPTGSYVDQG